MNARALVAALPAHHRRQSGPQGTAQPFLRPSHAPRELVFDAPATRACARAARRCAASVLVSWGLPVEARETAELIIAELTANAALHGGCEMTMRLTLIEVELEIDVSDRGVSDAEAIPESCGDEHGRGLTIVSALADWVHTECSPEGRRVLVGLSTGVV